MSDPPFSKLDLVCCRNVLIYLKPDIQQKIIGLFHFALAENGFLFLGSAETIGVHEDTFVTLSKRWRVYRRIGPTQPERLDFPVVDTPARHELRFPVPGRAPQQITHLAERWLLEWLAPSAVLINRKGRILYISGNVDPYLVRNAGAPSDDLAENLRKGLLGKVRGAVEQALEARQTMTADARVNRGDGYVPVRIVVRPLPSSGEEVDHLLILFNDVRAPAQALTSTDPTLVSRRRPSRRRRTRANRRNARSSASSRMTLLRAAASCGHRSSSSSPRTRNTKRRTKR